MSQNQSSLPIYTLGHSTRPIEAFVELLRAGNVQRLVDVRSIPRSRTNPQYNLETLPDLLEQWQIRHTIIPALGGRRSRQKDVAPEVNAYWNNQSFHNYADYALSSTFQDGLDELTKLADEGNCAIMCSEAVWWRCHRRIIADYLLFRGRTVLHLMGENRIAAAKMTLAAVPRNGVLNYPNPS